jgi:hypothetical protein
VIAEMRWAQALLYGCVVRGDGEIEVLLQKYVGLLDKDIIIGMIMCKYNYSEEKPVMFSWYMNFNMIFSTAKSVIYPLNKFVIFIAI